MTERNEKKSPKGTISPELVARAKAGDQDAFSALYEQTHLVLYRSVRSMVRDEDLTWDILQDSYLRAFRSMDKLEADEAFLPWLRRIAVNEAARQMAKRLPVSFTDLAGDDEEEDREPVIPDLSIDSQPELALDRKETARLVREILSDLPEGQQMILGMRYYEDMPVKEIAAALHVAPGTVMAQLHKGRKKVEARVRALEQQGVKLYGLGPIPFLVALLRKLEPAAGTEKKAAAAVLAQAAASGGSQITAMTAGQAFLHGLGAKLLAGILAVVMIAVGGKLAYDALSENRLPFIGDERPTAAETLATGEDAVNHVEKDTAPETDLPKLYAPDDTPENACGPNLTWRFDPATRTLTIEGNGAMYNYDDNTRVSPWHDYNYMISFVVLPEELTSIGSRAFENCSHLASVTIPAAVSSIGRSAFDGCKELKSVSIPKGVTAIEEGAFADCSGLTAFSVSPDIPYYMNDAFGLLYNKDQTALIACPSGKSDYFEIPEGVLSIGGYAFESCTGLSYIILPESVTSVGELAFGYCCGLTSLTLSESLVSIGDEAFRYCSSLTDLRIPASVTEIGERAFIDCSELETISVDPENVNFRVDESGVLYNMEQTKLIACPCKKTGSYTVPAGVITIGNGAFYACEALRSVTLPEGLTTIGDSAFCGCFALTDASIPESVTSIGAWAFANTDLSRIELPAGLTFIGNDAFTGCHTPTTLTIPAGLSSIGDGVFSCCSGLTSVAIPEGVTSIGGDAFNSCTGLRTVTFPESLTSIGEIAFEHCNSLTELTIPEGVTSIGKGAFAFCNNLEAFFVHPSNPNYTADAEGVLYNKEKTQLITCPAGKSDRFAAPGGVTAIGYAAFGHCGSLTSITLPSSVTTIDECAFCGCERLISLTIPEGVTAIEEYTFDNCSDLTAVTIPDTVTTIGDSAFANCTNLTSVSIPEGVASIGSVAFENCFNLYDLELPEGVTSIGDSAFRYSGLTAVTIPAGVTYIESGLFCACKRLSSVTIPETVNYIEETAFEECDNLTIRGIPGSEAERYANENGIPFEALSEVLYRDVLAEAHTAFPAIQNRTDNLKLACAAIDGTVLMPGETFSFNGVVGQPTEEKGYLPAIDSVSGGESASEVGGGVSQVASSIYYAVLQADLATVERSPHMYPVDYVPMGMDAAVSWNSQDFRFENTSPYPVKLEASVSDGKVHIVLRGTEWKDYTVELSHEILESIEWATVEKEVPNDGTYQNGEVLTTPLTGYKIATYRTARSVETGSKLETTEIAVSRYETRDKVIAKVVGTEP